jgi:hypothetical protein
VSSTLSRMCALAFTIASTFLAVTHPAAAADKLVYTTGNDQLASYTAWSTFPNAASTPPAVAVAAGIDAFVDLSPNGQMIAYTINETQLYTKDLETGAVTLVYSAPCIWRPKFSPDGQTLFFSATTSGTCQLNQGWDIWRVNIDGTGARAVITWKGGQRMDDVSPDGNTIMFDSNTTAKGQTAPTNIYVANTDGSNAHVVNASAPTTVGYPDWDSSFSPDGTKIAFNCDVDLCLMNANGTGLLKLTSVPSQQYADNPRWSPDGSELCVAYTTNRSMSNEARGIAIYTPSGTQLYFVQNGTGSNEASTCAFRHPSTTVDENAYLAAQFMPILRFDSTEKWRPLNVGMFLAEQGPSGAAWNQVCTDVAHCGPLNGEATLRQYPTGGFIVEDGLFQIAPGDPYTGGLPDSYVSPNPSCVQTMTFGTQQTQVKDCDTGPASAIYYHVVGPSPGGYTYIDYWFFYRYNQGPADVGDHPGDWEGVTVAESPLGDTFEYAEFSQHGTWYTYLRQNLECDNGGAGSCGSDASMSYYGQHLMTFPAAGDHANYPYPGSGNAGENGNDGQAHWGRNLQTNAPPSTCPTNVPASPPEVCGPALIQFPTPQPQGSTWSATTGRFTDWPGLWGITSDSPASPAGSSTADHGNHYFAPWSPSGNLDCTSNGGACPSRVATSPARCANWFGGGVVALVCNAAIMREALRRHTIQHRGTFGLRSALRGAATAPGIAQLLGHPLRAGQRLTIRGRIPRGTSLMVRVERGRHIGTVVFENIPAFQGRATVHVGRGKQGLLLVRVVQGNERIRPTYSVSN